MKREIVQFEVDMFLSMSTSRFRVGTEKIEDSTKVHIREVPKTDSIILEVKPQ